jgi:C1A family cysteine protease
MRKRRHGESIAGMAAVLLLGVLLLAPAAHAARSVPEAAAPKTPRSAPLSPDFVLWQAMSSLDTVLDSASPHGLGLRPSPEQGFVATGAETVPAVDTAYPSSYDLRTLGKLTAVRNQGAFGTCWSFAALGSLESSSLPGETLDLSEDNMVLTSGFDVSGATTPALKYEKGGNIDMAAAYLARWGGPVYETDDAYGDAVTPSGLTARRHVQDIDYYAGRTSATDNDRIKYAVSTYGGAYVSMSWQGATSSTSTYYNALTHAYYYDGTASTNHGVVVVGWDDAYLASNFSTTPTGNGAFIVRNSWGSGWGESGYFYVSYYDTRFACQYTSGGYTYTNDAATFEVGQAATNYGGVYQYDPLGAVGALGYGAGVAAWGANVFSATATSTLSAVGFYANAPNTAYEVYEGPSTTSLTKLTSGTLSQMGFHTVAVPSGTTLSSGATFVVAVKLTTPGYGYPLAYEYPVANYTSAATASAGQSLYSSSGTSWADFTSYRANANFCLKAYATVTSAPTSSSAYAFAADAVSGWKTSSQSVTIDAAGGTGTGLSITYSQDGGATWTTVVGTTATVTVSSQGAHHVKYYAHDSLATEGVHDAGYVNVDTVAPITTDNHASVSLVNSAAITLSPTDATSGMGGGYAKTEYKVDGAATYTTGTSVTLSTLGSHTVAYRSTDKAGNMESPDRSFTVTVRAPLAPTSTSAYSFAADASSGWKTTSQSVTMTASGGDGTGCAIRYSRDGGSTWSTVVGTSATATVSAEGAHHFKYYAYDSLATETTHDAGYVNVDTVAPATSDDHVTAPLVTPATITLSPSDATSGMTGGAAKTEYKVDGAAGYTTGTSVVLGVGAHTVVYRSTDKAGNLETPDHSFTVDVTVAPPTSSTTYDGFAGDSTSGWKTGSQSVTIDAAGGTGTGLSIRYSQDGGSTWTTVVGSPATATVNSDGTHHFKYYAYDSLATETTHDAGYVNIDTTAPITSDDSAIVPLLAPATVTLTPSELLSGMTGGSAKTEYKVDGAPAYSTGTTVVLAVGTHTVAYRSTDKAGNTESPDKHCTVTVLQPAAPASATGYAFSSDGVSGWKNTAQSVALLAAGGSGAHLTIFCSLDGGVTWTGSAGTSMDVPVSAEGAHHFLFYAGDSLATETVHDAGWVNIDSVRPTTVASATTVRRGKRVALKFRVGDTVPGCGSATVKIQIKKRRKVLKTISLGTKATNTALSYKYAARLPAGKYTWRVLATDAAGNAAARMTAAKLVIR